MISFEFIKTVESHIKKYDSFQLPVLICDKSLEVHWKNEKSKTINALSVSLSQLTKIFSELDVDEVIKTLALEGNYVAKSLIPLFGASACIFPILDQNGQLAAMEIIFVEQGNHFENSANFVSKTSSKLLQQLNNSIDDIFRANDALVLNANLLEARWTAPFLDTINMESYKLLRISNNLNAYIKLQNNLAIRDLEIVDICQWMKSMKPIITQLINDNKIQFEFLLPENPIYLPMDMKWFQIIFFNLLHNSVYHSKAKNKITVSLKEIGDEVEVLVKDQGCGIEDKFLDKVKKPYFSKTLGQTSATTGLGLTIADRATEVLGGQLQITSCENKGTIVAMIFPGDVLKHPTMLRQNEKSYNLRNKFSPVYIGLTSAVSSDFFAD